jgi:hypothetical protein
MTVDRVNADEEEYFEMRFDSETFQNFLEELLAFYNKSFANVLCHYCRQLLC